MLNVLGHVYDNNNVTEGCMHHFSFDIFLFRPEKNE